MSFRPLALVLPLLALLLLVPARAGVLGDDYNEEEGEDYLGLPRLRLSLEGGFSQWLFPEDTSLTAAGKKYLDRKSVV